MCMSPSAKLLKLNSLRCCCQAVVSCLVCLLSTGAAPGFGFGGASRALYKGTVPLPRKFFIWGSRNAYFGVFSGPSECLLLHCNTSSSRPPVRLPSLTFRADCGSVKDAEVPAKEVSEHYLPTTNLIIANVEILTHDDSNSHSFSSDGHEFEGGGQGPLAPLDPPLSVNNKSATTTCCRCY